MSSKRKRGLVWEFVFKKAGVLDKPLYLTFTSEEEGDAYSLKLEALLARGIVPTEYQTVSRIITIGALVQMYLRDAHVKAKDQDILATLCKTVGALPLASINAKWVDNWISDLKRVHKLAPATTRAKVGALARCTDWGMRKGLLLMPDHPFRTLPKGYAQYTQLDTAMAGGAKKDMERDRRLEPGEFDRIVAVLQVGILPRKQRPYILPYTKSLMCLALLAIESAMRMREMYTLTLNQVDLAQRTVFLEKTKNGSKRQVPLSSVALDALKTYLLAREVAPTSPENAVFPWWDGSMDRRKLAKTSDFLSKLFSHIFKQAGCADLTFHDLRHEATSRLFEKTRMSETEIMKITGHKSHAMMMRYTNLRGSNLADKLW